MHVAAVFCNQTLKSDLPRHNNTSHYLGLSLRYIACDKRCRHIQLLHTETKLLLQFKSIFILFDELEDQDHPYTGEFPPSISSHFTSVNYKLLDQWHRSTVVM